MRWVHALGAAVAATTLVGSVAKATISVNLVQIPVNGTAAGAISSSPVRTFQLQVTQSAGEKWNVGSMQVTLASGGALSGYFYASPNHDNVGARNSNFNNAYATTDPNFYDTFVSTPQFDVSPTGATQAASLSVPGSSDFPNTGTASNTAIVPTTAGNSTAGNQTMNIVWGDMQGDNATTDTTGATSYTVAQFTIVGNTGAFLRGYSGGTAASNTPLFFPNNGTGAIGASTAQGLMYIPILGDIGKDGTVGSPDLNAVLNNFGLNGNGDTNGDNQTGSPDLNAVLNNFGNTIGAPPATGAALGSLVPEPATLGLLALAGLATIRRRK